MRYEQIETLEEYLSDVEETLLKEDECKNVSYPSEYIFPWDAKKIDEANHALLSMVSGEANVYAIFTAPKNSDIFSLRYIGKTTRKLARQRIRNHLIKKNERTGAKLNNIISHIQSRGSVKLSWVKIEPESLRNYVEEELIKRHKEANWNRENA